MRGTPTPKVGAASLLFVQNFPENCMNIGGSKGAPGMCTPRLGPNSFNFMQLGGGIGKNNRLAPPPLQLAPLSLLWEIMDPPLMKMKK